MCEYYKGSDNESAVPLTPAIQPTPRQCVGVTPKKKNRSRSTSFESREHEVGGSAKKRKHDSNHRSRSTGKKFKDELWRENGHNKTADLAPVATPTSANKQNSATEETKAGVAPNDMEIKSEQCDCTINSTAEPVATSEQQQQQPSIPSGIKEEPGDEVYDKADTNDAVTILTPRVRIVDIRSHLTEDEEPVSPCANSQTYPVVNNGSTTSKCSIDQNKKDCAAKPKAETVVDDASHPVAETCSSNAEEEQSSQKH